MRPELFLAVFIDVGDSVFHRCDLFGIFIRNLDSERFFKRHHKLYDVERIRAQIVHERRGRCYFRFVHSELLHNNLFYSFIYARHFSPCVGTIPAAEFTGLLLRRFSAIPTLYVSLPLRSTAPLKMQAHQPMCKPPFTSKTCPVIYPASSLAKNTIADAISASVPMRPSGI